MIFAKQTPFLLFVVAAVFVSSCGQPQVDPELIIPDRVNTDLRKPAVPSSEVENYPLYPQVKERGPIPSVASNEPRSGNAYGIPESSEVMANLPDVLDSILNETENSEVLQGVIATALENAPRVIEDLQRVMEENGVEAAAVEKYGPELFGAILKGDSSEISPETMDELSGVISEFGPVLVDEIFDQANQGEDSTIGAVAGFVLEKLFQSK